MGPKLIGEEGLLSDMTISLDKKKKWTIGRDHDQCDIQLEDPSVSRKHLLITKENEDYFVENLSLINPILMNRAPIKEKTKIAEGSTLQIGSTLFRFTHSLEETSSLDGADDSTFFDDKAATPTMVDLSFPQSRFLLKVLSGPNSGAEFFMQIGKNYIIGKDPTLCDIVFHDRSVSAEHASLLITPEGTMEVRDLGSRNGIFINNMAVDEKSSLQPNQVIQFGTTSFVVIDTKAEAETIISPTPKAAEPKKEEAEPMEKAAKTKAASSIRRLFVPTQDVFIAGFFGLIVLIVGLSGVMLFKQQKPVKVALDYHSKIESALHPYYDIEFTFNPTNRSLLLVGNVSTTFDRDQFIFKLKKLDFIKQIDNKVVIDELIWQEMNSIIAKNPNWQTINMHSPKPGSFVVTGYLKNREDWQSLQDYLNLNFTYLNKLENRVVVEEIAQQEIEKLITEQGFGSVASTFTDGEVVLSGSIGTRNRHQLESLIRALNRVDGVRNINNLVVYQQHSSNAVDISNDYRISGTTESQGENLFAIINGKMYQVGNELNGMKIEKITNNRVFLEKDGLKYRIDYTL